MPQFEELTREQVRQIHDPHCATFLAGGLPEAIRVGQIFRTPL